MKTDIQIKDDVLEELAWQINTKETEIGVIVDKGVVTLTGVVDSFAKKMAVENATKTVNGVKAIADDIKIKYGNSFKRTDGEIAKAAVEALFWNISVPADDIKIKVEDGWVYLSGDVNWPYEKKAANKAVQNLLGVKGVINNIALKQALKPEDIREKISKAFKRSSEIDSKNINVIVDGHTVKLRGKVHSLHEKDEAREAAYFAPGVYKVENELEVTY